MDERVPDKPLFERPLEGRLDSWKEIAAYLDRDVTTVQRWEKREGMPVHRHLHERTGSVHAFQGELDAWAQGRLLPVPQQNPRPLSPETTPESVSPAPGLPLVRSAQVPGANRISWVPILSVAALAATLGFGLKLWLQNKEDTWRSPIEGARFQPITELDGMEQAAALSRDGQFAAFLSNQDGPTDVWVTQLGSGQFHNLTHGNAKDILNHELRNLSFSPDGSFVTYWSRKPDSARDGGIGIWAVPTLGGQPRPYLEGVAEFDWSRDGSRLVYHTAGPGDPVYVSDGGMERAARIIFTASAGVHCHFPLWSPDMKFVYFVQGSFPNALDVWRILSVGGTPERITSHHGEVTYPVLLNARTLLYLARDLDGSGPWLYGMDIQHRIPHPLSSGLDRYTSLAASVDGRRLVATRATAKRSLWRFSIGRAPVQAPAVVRIPLETATGISPRLGPDYLLYISATSTGDSIWKLVNGTGIELWGGPGARVSGSPAISPDGQRIAFSARQNQRTLLYVMRADGTGARILSDSIDLQGGLGWTHDGQSIVVARKVHGVPHIFRVSVDGRSMVSLTQEYSEGPVCAPDGRFVVYSGPNIGTTFPVKAVTSAGTQYHFPVLNLTRGARHLVLMSGGKELAFLRGEMQHKDLWSINLETGAERQLSDLPPDFDVRDFDISQDGHEVVLERDQDRSDVVLIDLPKP